MIFSNHGVITNLEPDILECEVKWAFGSITTNKASGGEGIPIELLQILRADAVQVLHSICQQIWKSQQWPQDLKGSVFTPIPKKGNAKECLNYCTIALISHASKVMLKFSKPGFNSTWTSWTELNTLGWLSHKESACNAGVTGTFNHFIWKIPWRRKWHLTPVFSPGESNGQKSLSGYRPEGCKVSNMTEAT